MDAYRRFINRELPWEERSCTSKVQLVTRDEALSHRTDGHAPRGDLRPAPRGGAAVSGTPSADHDPVMPVRSRWC
jgi:hypothetical protein